MLFRSVTARRGTTALAVVALGAGALVTALPAGAAPASRTSFPGSVPGFVSTSNDAGPAADTTVEGEVYLPLRNQAGAQALATAVSTPGNPAYGRYLTPTQWIAKFSPTQADFTAVENYLTAQGQTIYATPASRQFIVFRGPASSTAAAFGTTLHNYRVAGTTVSAPSSAPSVPASVGGKILAITLGNARAALTRPTNIRQDSPATSSLKTASTAPSATPAAAAAAIPCSSYFGQNTATVPLAYGKTSFPTGICGYLPTQLRSAGNVNKLINAGNDGTGQTVAIVDAYASPTIQHDTNSYMQAVGSPLLSNLSQLKPAEFVDDDLCGGPSGWQAEEAIDVQSAHSIAPGAKILYSGGFNCGGGIDVALAKILDGKLAKIVSNSYGYTGEAIGDAAVAGQNNQFTQAAAEGIGLYFSSGDAGDNAASLGYPAPDFPATSPFVTAVGGTSEAINANGSYGFETGWGSSRDQILNGAYTSALPGVFRGGAGGGTSAVFAQPAYQVGTVPSSLSTGSDGTPSRVIPDIGDLADPYTGFQIGISPIVDNTTLQTGPFVYETYGGTSLASPIAAAKMALVQQAIGKTVGFANPALYAADKASPAGFHDVAPRGTTAVAFTSPSTGFDFLVTLDGDTSLATAKGYDDVTGIGTLNVPLLVGTLTAK